jgi:P-type Cu+ transporter
MAHVATHPPGPPGTGRTPPSSVAGRYVMPAIYGGLAMLALLGLYFSTLTLVSGWAFTAAEFRRYGTFIVALAGGFGTQVALFSRLRSLVGTGKEPRAVVAASGTTSTAAMVSCCAHYLVNVAPVLGATGLVAFAAQFQVEFFWVGLAFSAGAIAFMLSRVLKAEKEHAKCAP